MRFGIVGAGRIAPAYLAIARHFPAIAAVAIADRSIETARQQAAEWSIDSCAIDELLRREDIDTVVNLTPVPAHFEVSQAILEAGKHLYSEKPLTGSLAQSRALLALAERHGLRVASAPDTFLGAAPQLAGRLIDEGRIGSVVAAGASFIMDGGHFSERFFNEQIGPLRELGPYYLTALLHLLGPVTQLTGISRNPVRQRRFEDKAVTIGTPSDFRALLQFESGVVADFTVSVDAVATGRAPVEIQGTSGTLLLPDPNFFGGDVVLIARNGLRETFTTDALPLGRPNWNGDSLANYRSVGLAEMAEAIAQGRPVRASGEMAAHVAEIIALLLSGGTAGRTMPVESRFQRPAALTPAAVATLLNQTDSA